LAILILAAGSSSRLGQSKQLIKVSGETLLERTTRMALEVCHNVFVVLGSNSETHVKTINHFPVFIIENAKWEKGMGSSLKSGLHQVLSVKPETESVMILVCDQPMLTTAHLEKLIEEAKTSEKKIISSSYKNVWGVPALFKKEIFPTLNSIEDEEGARKIIQRINQEVLPIDFKGGEIDIDTPEDLKNLFS
jgi:molybdenum cofactor cytidylyltransferase